MPHEYAWPKELRAQGTMEEERVSVFEDPKAQGSYKNLEMKNGNTASKAFVRVCRLYLKEANSNIFVIMETIVDSNNLISLFNNLGFDKLVASEVRGYSTLDELVWVGSLIEWRSKLSGNI